MRTRAAVLERPGDRLQVVDVDLDPPRAHEVLVRIAASGVCGSDLHVLDGSLPEPMPMVLGHEASGMVVDVGPDVASLSVGDHVVLSIVPPCLTCPPCRSGRVHLCQTSGRMAATGTLADGTSRLHRNGRRLHHFNSVSSFADLAVVPEAGAVRIPPDLDLETAALLGCAVLTGVGAVLNTAAVPPGSRVVVLGCGGVGLSVVQGARLAGAGRIVAADPQPERLAVARTLGATDTVVPDGEGSVAVEAIRRACGGDRGADFVFEALGSARTIRQGWEALDPGGALVVVGMMPKGELLTIDPWGFISEKRILGCFLGSADPARDVPRLADLALSGQLELGRLSTTRIGLDELPDHVERIRAGEGVRCLVVP